VGNSLRATFSLSRATRLLPTALVTAVALAGCAAIVVRSPAARVRFAAARGWVAWGGTWCLLSWMAVATIFPFWAPNRSQLGSVGFAAGAVGLAAAVHPAGPAVLVAARLGLLAAGPRTPAGISAVAEDRGAFMDYPKLSRLQQLMSASRRALKARHPALPAGSRVGWHDLPLSAEYAFGGPLAVQAWYRDTTLGWTTMAAFSADPPLPAAAFLCYQPGHMPQVVIIEPEAERARLAALEHMKANRWIEMLAALDRADSCQRDRAAAVFLGDLAGRRGYAFAQLGRWDEAERQSRLALRAAPIDYGARFVLAAALMKRRQDHAADAHLDTLLAMSPTHEGALALRASLRTRDAAADRSK